MHTINQLTAIFCELDDFCKELHDYQQSACLPSSSKPAKKRGPSQGLCDSEIMLILVAFQSSGFRHFKIFYTCWVMKNWNRLIPNLPSYNRFIELISSVMMALFLFSQLHCGKRTGIYYIDSTCLPVCHLKRSRRHKTFEEIAQYGRTSVGWFFGLKLHLVINHQGELIAFKITPANQSDIQEAEPLLKKLRGLTFGDKGYISKKVFEQLLKKGLKLITRVRKNMKEVPLSSTEKQLLDQRGIVETVIGYLKFHYHVWHTRHRSVLNAVTHLLAALASYTIEPLRLSAIRLLSSTNLLT